MKNFIFKSQQDFHKIVFNKLVIIQSELRHQRLDHVQFRLDLNKLFVELNLSKQADEYYQSKIDSTRTDADERQDLTQDPHDPDEI